MKFSYNWLKELARFKDKPEALAEFLTLHVFEMESVEKKDDDYALDIKLLPNRVSDASGHIGMAREIATLQDIKFETPYLKLVESRTATADLLSVKIEAGAGCHRYTARIIKKIKVSQSPAWLKKRLETCGLQSINNVVDAANFIMLETGQPLHIFDYEKLVGKKIVVRTANKKERLLALDEKTYELSPEILVIADAKKPVAIAGIKGGKDSGVTASTKTIILEAASFNPSTIRTGSKLLNLKTDASYRFEHGLDPNMTETAIDRLASMVTKLAGGEILKGRIDVYPQKTLPKHILLNIEHGNRLVGVKFAPVMYEVALKRLGFSYQKTHESVYHVEIPTARRDIEIEEDVIEEIIRLWGYDKIQPQKPLVQLDAPKQNDELYWEDRAKDFFIGAGFTEIFRYVFTGENELNTFGLDKKGLIELANPLTADHRYLASSPLTTFIRVAKENEAHENAIRVFGLTKSFKEGKGKWIKNIDEKKEFVIVLSQKETDGDLFFQLKGVIDGLFESLGLAEHWYNDAIPTATRKKDFPFLHPFRTAEIKIDNTKIGYLGEVHPEIKSRLKAKHTIVAAELDATLLYTLAEKEAEFIPLSRFPAIVHDIALIVPENEKTENITNILENVGGKLLIDTNLFDYFQDEAMRKGRQKSLAFHLIFQSKERTLKEEEVVKITEKIVKALEEKEWTVRK
ncbi:MAG: phenylalanine--tRNA ligase subunit beta [bacterium]|nr:phenylalanine--tRNA ligase subunit beta [bacterium]